MNGEHIGTGLIDPAHLALVWPKVRGWIGAALKHYAGAPQSVRATRVRVRRRRYGLMVATYGERIVGAVVMEFGELRGVRVLHIIAAGGERGSLATVGPSLWQSVQHVAQVLGADRVRVEGRRAWLRWIRSERGRVRQVVIDFPVEKAGV